MKKYLFLILCLASICGCSETSDADIVVMQQDRKLAIAITTGHSGDFIRAYELVRETGADRVGEIDAHWNKFEISPGQFEDPFLYGGNQFYAVQKMPVSLTISPVETNHDLLPADLKGLRWDDRKMIERFSAYTRWVLSRFPDVDLDPVLMGNEFDVLLGDDPAQWQAFTKLFTAFKQQVKRIRPEARVGAEMTFGGIFGKANKHATNIIAQSDLAAISHYPLDASGKVLPPDAVHGIFDRLAEAFPDKPIYLMQWGYPSAGANGSSEALQQQFVIETFKAWDKRPQHIQLITFTWLHDLSPAETNAITEAFGFANKSFVSFLGSLGIREFDGDAKPAYDALSKEANKRGWRWQY